MSLGRIVVDLLARTGAFETDLARASKATKTRMKEIEKAANDAGRVLGVALAAGATAAAVALKAAVDNADMLGEKAQSMGVTVEQLSRLQVAAKLGATDLDTLGTAFGKLAKLQVAFSEGDKDVTALFGAMKISADVGRDTGEVMRDLADVFKTLPDGAQKTALAIELFGKSGAALIPFLNQGADKIEAMNEQADKLGITISGNTAQAASDFNDQIDLMTLGVQGLASRVAADLLPDMVSLANSMFDASSKGDDLNTTAKNIADSLRTAFNVMEAGYHVTRGLIMAFVGLGDAIAMIGDANLIGIMRGKFAESKAAAQAAFEMAGESFSAAGSAFDAPASIAGGFGVGGPSASLSRGHGRQKPADNSIADALAQRAAEAKRLADADKAARESSAAGARMQAAAERELAEAKREQQRLDDAAKDAAYDLTRILEDLRGEIGGPLVQAQNEYNREMAILQSLLDANPALVDQVTEAQGLLGEALKKTTAEIKAQQDAAEAEKMLKPLTDAQLESIDFADGMRESLSDSIMMAFKDGDVLGAIDNFIGSIASALQRRLADSIADSLLGAPGTSGGGLFGSVLSGLGGLFGGGGGISNLSSLASVTKSFSKFATGTDYAPGGMAWVGERGPELVNLPRGSQVIPADKSARMGGNTITINIAGHATKETAQQIASKVAQQMAFAGRAR